MHKAAGGLKSRNVTHRSAGKAEPKPNAMNVKAASQIGGSQGDHLTEKSKILKNVIEPLHAGRGYAPPVGPTDNVKAVGVGGGRTVYRSGFQGQHGDVAGSRRPQGRGILNNE